MTSLLNAMLYCYKSSRLKWRMSGRAHPRGPQSTPLSKCAVPFAPGKSKKPQLRRITGVDRLSALLCRQRILRSPWAKPGRRHGNHSRVDKLGRRHQDDRRPDELRPGPVGRQTASREGRPDCVHGGVGTGPSGDNPVRFTERTTLSSIVARLCSTVGYTQYSDEAKSSRLVAPQEKWCPREDRAFSAKNAMKSMAMDAHFAGVCITALGHLSSCENHGSL